MLEDARRAVDGLPIQIERDGSTVRFIWTGDDAGIKNLGFAPPLPHYTHRDDVPVWLLRRPGKSQVPAEHRKAAERYWKGAKPFLKPLKQGLEDARQDSLNLANGLVSDYNEILTLAASVAAPLARLTLRHDRLSANWRKATGYLRGTENPPGRHPSPPDLKWKRAFTEECERLKSASSDFGPFVEAVTGRVTSVLDARAEKLASSSVLRAREVVLTAFLEEIEADGDAACRPPPHSFWTWPYNLANADHAFLGVLAMRLFENDSAEHVRNVGGDFRNRRDFRFEHAPAAERSSKGGLLVLKEDYRDRTKLVEAVLQSMTRVWQLHGGGKVRPVGLATVKRAFKSAIRSDIRGRLQKLKKVEQEYGVAVPDDYRYDPPANGDRRLGPYVALAASVAVAREIELARTYGESPAFEDGA